MDDRADNARRGGACPVANAAETYSNKRPRLLFSSYTRGASTRRMDRNSRRGQDRSRQCSSVTF